MITINNRLPTKPNRWKITHESDSSEEYITWAYADEPTVEGTPINKALLEGIQTDLMQNTELIVAEYTADTATASIEISNLDFEDDGSFYEIIFSGKQSSSTSNTLCMQINAIDSGYYVREASSQTTIERTAFYLGALRNAATQYVCYLSKADGYFLLRSMGVYRNGSSVYEDTWIGFLLSSANLTKLTFSVSSGTNLVADTNIKIIKRR